MIPFSSRVGARRALVNVRPFVVLAARVMGPGPLRLKLVKLAHELDSDRGELATSRRAA
jgi:hypothetical protein